MGIGQGYPSPDKHNDHDEKHGLVKYMMMAKVMPMVIILLVANLTRMSVLINNPMITLVEAVELYCVYCWYCGWKL